MKRWLALAALAALLFPLYAWALSGEEVMQKSQAAFLYPGKDFKARVLMKLISKDGQVRVREMTLLRKNMAGPGGEQKYFMYFFQPADVKDMSFMIYKYPAKNADRWMFIPAINMVKRIAAQDNRSSFVGSDFTYEDVSGRNIEDDSHVIEREEKLGNRDCYVVKSTPKAGDADFGYKLTWIDKANFLPLKEVQYDKKGAPYKQYSADEITEIKGFPTVIKRTMKNLQTGHSTSVVYLKADYDLGIEDSLFSERFLRQPPRKWIE
ncbi:MAG: outer membrane lipoprotein-sorting protein [Betaproteobacteria bacterium]|nr:outer membrane lipoprotein-sorting protein [Rhodospirillales bacterium]MDA8255297.1 outer membrane lipoprotein-sorting protein [Betaproteobacteria bacterium]